MSCPDATPDYDPIKELERQAKIAAERVIDAKNEKYIGSTKFWEDVDALMLTAGRTVYGQKQPETLEEKVEWIKQQFKKVNSDYTASLYK